MPTKLLDRLDRLIKEGVTQTLSADEAAHGAQLARQLDVDVRGLMVPPERWVELGYAKRLDFDDDTSWGPDEDDEEGLNDAPDN